MDGVGKSLNLAKIRSPPARLVLATMLDLEASGASRRLFYAVKKKRHRSLKTQQRTFKRRVLELGPASVGPGESYLNLVGLTTRLTFELKLIVEGLPASAGAKSFTESLILAQDERWRRA